MRSLVEVGEIERAIEVAERIKDDEDKSWALSELLKSIERMIESDEYQNLHNLDNLVNRIKKIATEINSPELIKRVSEIEYVIYASSTFLRQKGIEPEIKTHDPVITIFKNEYLPVLKFLLPYSYFCSHEN